MTTIRTDAEMWEEIWDNANAEDGLVLTTWPSLTAESQEEFQAAHVDEYLTAIRAQEARCS